MSSLDRLRRGFAVSLLCMLCAVPVRAAEPEGENAADPWPWISLGGVVTVYAGLGTWAFFAWYDEPPEHGFEFNEDGWFGRDTYAGGADKLGHLWSNLALTRLSADILEAGGWSPAASSWISAGVTTVFFTLVEVKDAYYYAFSFGDMAANLGGTALAVGLRAFPAVDDVVDFRVSYWPSPAYRKAGGVNFAEDYSGQTYLLAVHGEALTPDEGLVGGLARYVDVTLGYRAVDFKPERPPNPPRRELCLGLTLNLGRALDDLFFRGEPGGGWGRFGRGATRVVTEHVNAPWTVVPLVGLEDDP